MLRRAAESAAAPWLALLLLVAAAHGGTLADGFVWDDAKIIVENPATRDLSRIGEVVLSPDQVRPYYRPLNRASYLVDHALFGMDARAFHAVNLLVHAASVLLLFALARRLLGATWTAFLAASLLAVHPIHGEAVAFVSARNSLLALAFALAALLLFVDATRTRSRALAWLSGGAFFLGLASKEQAAMVLPVAAAWLFLPGTGAAWRGWRAWRALVPHVCALGVYLVLRSIALGAPVGAAPAAQGLLARLAPDAWVMPRYLWLTLWPARLTIFHVASPPSGVLEILATAATWLAVAAAVAVLVRRPALASTVGLVWLAANLVPIANVVPLAATTPLAERFFHAPAVGIWLVVADAARRLAAGGGARRAIVLACSAVALVALAGRSAARTRDWHDDLALARAAVSAEPRAVGAWFDLGVALKNAGDLAGAERAWRAALSVDPRHAGTLTQLGTAAAVRGDYAQAETLLRAAIEADPELATAHLNLARVYDRTGRQAEALREYEAGLALIDRPEERQPAAVARVRELRR
ncbi:MAG TPA: tetratricopeptide repeat protein [Anaeromyxobacter sp.]